MSRRSGLALTLLACLLYLSIANDGRNHWHEWRYLYSATHFSVETLLAGGFDPGPPPDRSAAEVGAWYWGQALHEVLLAGLVDLLGEGTAARRALQWIYAALVLASALLWIRILRRLPLASDSRLVASVFLVSPLGCWLGFKLMAEAPALLLASLGALAFTRALGSRSGPRCAGWSIAAGLASALSFLSMVYLPLLVLGFAAATLALGAEIPRKRALVAVLGMLASFSIFVLVGLALLALSPSDTLQMYGFYRGYRKSWMVNLFGIATAGSLLYLLVPLALATPHRRDLHFYACWAAAALLPLVLLSGNYLEARFLVVAGPALAGLVLLGAQVLARRWEAHPRAVAAALVCSVAGISWVTLFLLPFEMSSRELRGLVEDCTRRAEDAVILLPWNYTDFHFLRFEYPDREILLVQAPVDAAGKPFRDEDWVQRRRRDYGSHYLDSIEELSRYRGRALFYLGHGRMPPFQTLSRWTGALGLDFVARRIDEMNPLEHITHSWMWENPAFEFREVQRGPHYRAYRVELLPD
jgi:hypothetical protein